MQTLAITEFPYISGSGCCNCEVELDTCTFCGILAYWCGSGEAMIAGPYTAPNANACYALCEKIGFMTRKDGIFSEHVHRLMRYQYEGEWFTA